MQSINTSDAPLQPREVSPSQARSLAWLRTIPTNQPRKVPDPDKPGVMPFVRLTMTLLFMLFVGWAAYLIGMWPITIVFAVVCVTGFIGAHNVGHRFTLEAFSHFDGWPAPPAAADGSGGQTVTEASTDGPTSPDGAAEAEGLHETGTDGAQAPQVEDAQGAGAQGQPLSAEAALADYRPSTDGTHPATPFGSTLLDADDTTARMMSAPLGKGLRRHIAEARAREAAATAAWLPTTRGFETAGVSSGDGTELTGHVLVTDPHAQRWVVFAHDYHGSWTDGLLYARHYAERGYNLLLVEMRGHGASGGRWIGMGYLDSLDLLAWCAWITTKYGDQAEIALHGCGMGASAALLCAGETALPSQVRAVVCEDVFTDAWNAIASVYYRLGLDVHPALDLVRSNLRRQQGGYDLALAAPIDYLDDVSVPVLFAHAAHDTFVPPYNSVLMYRKAHELHPEAGHAIASFDHAGHQMSSLGDEATFYPTVFGFLDSNL